MPVRSGEGRGYIILKALLLTGVFMFRAKNNNWELLTKFFIRQEKIKSIMPTQGLHWTAMGNEEPQQTADSWLLDSALAPDCLL